MHNLAPITGSFAFGSIGSTSTSTAMVASVSNVSSLYDGLCVYLVNSVVNSASGWTLNVNSLGAKPVYQTMAASSRVTTEFKTGMAMIFVYNSSRVSGGCWDMVYGYNIDSSKVSKSGDTMTGALTLAANKYYDQNSVYGLDAGNSDIVGLNGLYFCDSSEDGREGLNFYRDATHWDSLYANGGKLYFSPNRPKGSAQGPDGKLEFYARPMYEQGTVDIAMRPMVSWTRANRLAFLPADQVIIEQTVDGGTTWTSSGVSDSTKLGLFSDQRPSVTIPRINNERSTLCGVRITFTAMKYNVPSGTAETDKYQYWNSTYVASQERYTNLREMWFWLGANGDTLRCVVQCATGANPNNWATYFNLDVGLTGWSGSDWVRWTGAPTFGGGTNQTGNYWNWRVTFWSKESSNGTFTQTSAQAIYSIAGYGDSAWGTPNGLMKFDHLYTYDGNKNATFPAKVTASSFAGPLTGNVTGNVTGNCSGNAATATNAPTQASVNSSGLVTFKNGSGTNLFTLQLPADPAETDPVFTASAAHGISSSDISNWNNKLSSETDPVFSASPAGGITNSDISNWNGKTSNTGTVTKVTAGTGLKVGSESSGGDITTSGTINHINSVTAQNTQGLYPIKIDAQGHISAYGSAVTPVTSVNGKTGNSVSLSASDVGALADSYTPPVTSVNTKTGAVSLSASDVGALPDSYTPPVASVNSKTGAVVLTPEDISSQRIYRITKTISSAGWYRILSCADTKGWSIDFIISIPLPSRTAEMHKTTYYSTAGNEMIFAEEHSVGEALNIDKIRRNYTDSANYFDIHYTGSSSIDISLDFIVHGEIDDLVNLDLVSVADAPTGESVYPEKPLSKITEGNITSLCSLTKSSGSSTATLTEAYRRGNMVSLKIDFKTSAGISSGGDIWVGTFNGPKPICGANSVSYNGQRVLICRMNDSGGITMKYAYGSSNLSSGSTPDAWLNYLTE